MLDCVYLWCVDDYCVVVGGIGMSVLLLLMLEWMCVDIVGMLYEVFDVVGDDDYLIDFGLDLMCVFGLVLVWSNIGIVLEFSYFVEYIMLCVWWVVV